MDSLKMEHAVYQMRGYVTKQCVDLLINGYSEDELLRRGYKSDVVEAAKGKFKG